MMELIEYFLISVIGSLSIIFLSKVVMSPLLRRRNDYYDAAENPEDRILIHRSERDDTDRVKKREGRI